MLASTEGFGNSPRDGVAVLLLSDALRESDSPDFARLVESQHKIAQLHFAHDSNRVVAHGSAAEVLFITQFTPWNIFNMIPEPSPCTSRIKGKSVTVECEAKIKGHDWEKFGRPVGYTVSNLKLARIEGDATNYVDIAVKVNLDPYIVTHVPLAYHYRKETPPDLSPIWITHSILVEWSDQ